MEGIVFAKALMLVWGQPLPLGSYIHKTKLKLKFIGSLDTNPNTAASHTVDHEAKSLYDDDISYLCEHEMTRFQIGLEERVAWILFVFAKCIFMKHIYSRNSRNQLVFSKTLSSSRTDE